MLEKSLVKKETTTNQTKTSNPTNASQKTKNDIGEQNATKQNAKISKNSSKSKTTKKERLDAGILNEMFQNAHIALQSINDLLPAIDDTALKNELYSEQNSYDEFISKLSEFMESNSILREDVSAFKKAMLWGSIKMKTLTGATNNKVADMMIKGATSGVNELIRIKNHNALSPKVSLFLDELINIENNSIESFKEFL